MATAMETEQPQQQHQAAAEGEEEQLLFELAHVEMTYGGKDNPEGTGILRVSSRRLTWASSSSQQGQGGEGASSDFEAAVPAVTLHAISKDPSSFPKPCLYCQVTEDEDEEEAGSIEVYFAPQDPESLPALFEAMSKAALMNPDPPEPGEEEGDDELIYDQSGLDLAGCTAEQAAMLGRLDALMQFAPGLGNSGTNGVAAQAGQFDDAEEEGEGEGDAGVNGHNGAAGAAGGAGMVEEEDDDELPQ